MFTITHASLTGVSKPLVDFKIYFGYFGGAKMRRFSTNKTNMQYDTVMYVFVSQATHSMKIIE